jgi:nitroreductase
MDLFEAIEKRRSVRSLDPVEIPMAHLEKIVDAGRKAPSGMNRQPREFIIVTDRDLIQELSQVQGFMQNSSAMIAVVCDPNASKYWLEDMAAAVENMLLALVALGYDSCWVEGTLLRREEWAKDILRVPDNMRLMALLPIGKATSPGAQATKIPLREITHYNQYGNKQL